MLLSWMLGPFLRPVSGPILAPNPNAEFFCPMRKQEVQWQADHVFNPAAVERHGKIYVLYRAEDNTGSGIGGHTSRIGIAVSEDGVHFQSHSHPVLFPADDDQKEYDWPGGCEDPRIVEAPDGSYVMTYTAWNRQTARLSIATSKDLFNWKKDGPAFKGTPFLDTWSKSGSIVTSIQDSRLKAAQIDHRYWMYWGEGQLHMAMSSDLVHWTPLTDSSGNLITVLSPRPREFDSALVEPGPPAILTSHGIVLIYNGKNADSGGDPSVAPEAYCAGQALFSANDPAKLINRSSSYFLKPELPFEKTGQYASGTVFTEGLVLFRSKWLLYFGAADSFVNMAQSSR